MLQRSSCTDASGVIPIACCATRPAHAGGPQYRGGAEDLHTHAVIRNPQGISAVDPHTTCMRNHSGSPLWTTSCPQTHRRARTALPESLQRELPRLPAQVLVHPGERTLCAVASTRHPKRIT
jgi:hypothetical protein